MQTHDRSISKAEIKSLINGEDPVLLDVGCNNGDDALELIRLFSAGRIWCFEPDPRAIASFKAAVTDARCTLIEAGLGATCGKADFYMSGGRPPGWSDLIDWSYSGSIHTPTGHLSVFPWCTFEKTIQVEVMTLDSWFDRMPADSQIDFLWADVQGAEGDLIAGGRRTLERTRFFYTEFYDVPMYESQISLRQMQEMLRGWECVGLYGGNALFRNVAL
jgi:FkbM family methyltransferase